MSGTRELTQAERDFEEYVKRLRETIETTTGVKLTEAHVNPQHPVANLDKIYGLRVRHDYAIKNEPHVILLM